MQGQELGPPFRGDGWSSNKTPSSPPARSPCSRDRSRSKPSPEVRTGRRCAFPGPAYAELAVTTNFSFLRGASHPEELVRQAMALGLSGIGIADRNSVAGVVRAYSALEQIKEHLRDEAPDAELPAFKLIVGARLCFADSTPDILAYPQNRTAWGRLTRLLTVGKSRGEKAECILFFEDLLEHITGLNLIVMPPAKLPRRAS